MKKMIALCLALLCTLGLFGCNSNGAVTTQKSDSAQEELRERLQDKPYFTGVVEQVHDDYIIVSSTTMDGYPNGVRCHVSLNAVYDGSCTTLSVGESITVYYDGEIMETSPLLLQTVYAILQLELVDNT